MRLIAAKDWDDGDGFNGATDGDEIRVVETAGAVPPTRILLVVHELGHAIGLHHSDPKYGPSVMGANGWDPRDAAAAAVRDGRRPVRLDCGSVLDPLKTSGDPMSESTDDQASRTV